MIDEENCLKKYKISNYIEIRRNSQNYKIERTIYNINKYDDN